MRAWMVLAIVSRLARLLRAGFRGRLRPGGSNNAGDQQDGRDCFQLADKHGFGKLLL
jgi:hypothetical protein